MPLDEEHLVVRAMRAAFDALGGQPPGLRLACRNAIPHARGLGSSSAAIVGGLVLARALVDGGAERLDDGRCSTLAVELEGHPDNVAPALLGGFVISGRDERGQVYAVGSPVDPRIGADRVRPARAAVHRAGPRPAAAARSRTPTRPPTPGGPRCWSPRWPAGPTSSGGPPATTCTRTTGARRCRPRSPSSTRCAPTGTRRSSRAPGPPCWRSSPTASTWPAHCPDGWTHHRLAVDTRGAGSS